MTPSQKDALLFGAIALSAALTWLLDASIDVQMDERHLVLDHNILVILLLGPTLFIAFVIRGLFTRFMSIGTNIGMLIGTAILAFITYKFIDAQKYYLSNMKVLLTRI